MKTTITKEFEIEPEGMVVKATWSQQVNESITVTLYRDDKVQMEFDMTPNRAGHLKAILDQFILDTTPPYYGGRD